MVVPLPSCPAQYQSVQQAVEDAEDKVLPTIASPCQGL